MTPDDPRPASPDDPGTSVDELASALVDGELDPETAAAARARPDVAARAAELAAARDALRAADVPPPDPAAREQAIAAALAAFDDERGAAAPAPTVGPTASPAADPPPAPVPPVTPLDAPRRAHAARRRRTWQLAAAAAVLVLAGVLGVAIGTSDDDGGGDDTAASSVEPGDRESTTAGAAEEAPPAADDGLDTEAGGSSPDVPDGRLEVGDLGTFASADDLVDHVAGRVPGDHQVLPGADDGVPPEPAARVCSTPPAPLDDPSVPARLHGHAIVDGTPVDVWVIDDGGRSRLLAVDRDCRLAIDRLLP